MMKTRILLAVIIAFVLTSCRFENKVTEESNPDGSPKLVCVYLGKGEGREKIKETRYYPNHQPQMEGTFKDGKRDGKWISWYENGKVWSEGFYVRGKSDGKRTTYFENGKIRYDGYYKEDIRVGKWRFFDENGRLLQELDYSAPAK
jgi:antitoxin component YwqK of YwqJK toxin-antitoxin module